DGLSATSRRMARRSGLRRGGYGPLIFLNLAGCLSARLLPKGQVCLSRFEVVAGGSTSGQAVHKADINFTPDRICPPLSPCPTPTSGLLFLYGWLVRPGESAPPPIWPAGRAGSRDSSRRRAHTTVGPSDGKRARSMRSCTDVHDLRPHLRTIIICRGP